MKTWDDLTKIALLGVGKQAIVPEMLPEPLLQRLSGASSVDREDYGYRAAALAWAWQMAGTLPPVLPPPALQPAPETEESVCPSSLWSLLANCLEEPQRLGLFLERILEIMAEKGHVLPHFLLAPTLKHCVVTRGNKLKRQIGKVLGARGRWIAELNPQWRSLLPTSAEKIDFDTATALERREWLASQRALEPELVFRTMQQAWPTENARERKEWLKILAINPRQEELSFLEETLETILQSKDKDRPANLELRHLLSTILLRRPDSALFKQVQTQLANYVSAQSAMLGLVKKVSLKIPAQGDGFLCKEVMTEAFALDPVSPHKGWTDSEFWFGQLAGMMHPVVWELLFEAGWDKIIPAFDALHDEKKAPVHYPLQQLQHAIGETCYRPAVLTIAQQKGLEVLMTPEMYPALSTPELEQFLMNGAQKFATDLNNLQAYGREWDFSLAFSKHILKYLSQQKIIYSDSRFVQKIALMIHPGIIPDIREMESVVPEDYYAQSTQYQLFKPLIHLLQFRAQMEKALK
ncbi:MAG TPA: DUF5691 domain-containing protein [Saprospiraceae bacterium]|nr:DUF5691 domain-containing protein [Saprospiraceae bacterium]